MVEQKENRLVVHPGGWGDTIPDWILEEVKSERLLHGLAGLMKPGFEKVGDAKAVSYLYTASLSAPMPEVMTKVYLVLSYGLMKKRRMKLPADLKEYDRELNDEEKRGLKGLKEEIYRKRGGEIHHPLLDALRGMKKGTARKTKSDKKGKRDK